MFKWSPCRFQSRVYTCKLPCGMPLFLLTVLDLYRVWYICILTIATFNIMLGYYNFIWLLWSPYTLLTAITVITVVKIKKTPWEIIITWSYWSTLVSYLSVGLMYLEDPKEFSWILLQLSSWLYISFTQSITCILWRWQSFVWSGWA